MNLKHCQILIIWTLVLLCVSHGFHINSKLCQYRQHTLFAKATKPSKEAVPVKKIKKEIDIHKECSEERHAPTFDEIREIWDFNGSHLPTCRRIFRETTKSYNSFITHDACNIAKLNEQIKLLEWETSQSDLWNTPDIAQVKLGECALINCHCCNLFRLDH